MGCDSAADVMACLRAVPADTLAVSNSNHTDTGWVNIDPVVLPEDPYVKLQRLGSPVPVIVGSNSDELSFGYVFGPPLDAAGYADRIHTQFDAVVPGSGDTILSLYPATDFTNPNYALESVETDLSYTRAIYSFARDVSGPGRSPVYRYLFTHRYENPAAQDAFVTQARAFHGAETYFLTGSFQTLGTSVTYSPSSAESVLSEAMMDYWARMAATGDPNGPGTTQWTPYDSSIGDILQLDDTISLLPGGYRKAQMDYLVTLPIRGF
jgi:para-nitrobenzyl esterase